MDIDAKVQVNAVEGSPVRTNRHSRAWKRSHDHRSRGLKHPDERVARHSIDGKTHAGVVTFHRLSDTRTRLMVQIDWETQTLAEKLGAAVGVDDAQVKGDLKRFKEFIGARGTETGAWRGDV